MEQRSTAPDAGAPADRLLAWYDRHARTLPWRCGPKARAAGERPDPYRVWLSEVMLQQTGVKAVGPYFLSFVDRWPTVEALAAAADDEVMAAWAGLGYYSRARNLTACARSVASEYGGRFPATAKELATLPGIGAYTSAAIAALAFNEPIAVVDGNVERVMTRWLAIGDPMPAAKETVRKALSPIVPADRPGEFAEALMDLGATICTPKNPACALCPLNADCRAMRTGTQLAFPRKAPKKPRPTRYGSAFVARRADGAVLVRRRPPKGLLGGMVEVPGGEWAEVGPETAPPFSAPWRPLPQPVEHVFTHFRLLVNVHTAECTQETPAPEGCWWAPADDLPEIGLPGLMVKLVEAALPGATRKDGGREH
ncbi:MAG TPA: A/G-specific adenine glycosylase [Afifellaceae bacterium]|nr:A/G-specific adenine glycosylase [Afifellaceae bacterium]